MSDSIDLRTALGASAGESLQRLTLYIPSRDRHGVAFNAAPWIEAALRLLSAIGGGATAMPPADGAWLDPARDTLVREQVVLAYTFIRPDEFERLLPDLRQFLHRLGRDTGQGEIVCEFEGVLYRIQHYDR